MFKRSKTQTTTSILDTLFTPKIISQSPTLIHGYVGPDNVTWQIKGDTVTETTTDEGVVIETLTFTVSARTQADLASLFLANLAARRA